MRTRAERETVIQSGSPLMHHSLNQQKIRRSLEGERKVEISRTRKASRDEFAELIESLRSNKDFERLILRANELEEEKQPIPKRIGVIALTITSIINGALKNRGEQFAENVKGLPRFEFTTSPPHQELIPVDLMVNNFLSDIRQIPQNPALRELVVSSARLFAENFGGVIFSEGPELTALSGLIATKNITRYLAKEIEENQLDVFVARKMLVSFGSTVNQQLVRI